MAGKPIIPTSVHKRIREMHDGGMGKKAIAVELGYSLYTVRKAIEDGYAEKEAARHRESSAERYARRKENPDYIAYQKDRNSTDERRAQVRASMARLRAQKKVPD